MTHHSLDSPLLQCFRKLFSSFDYALDLVAPGHPEGGKARCDWVIIALLLHLFVVRPDDITPARRKVFLWHMLG
jgi:hypothetical protein